MEIMSDHWEGKPYGSPESSRIWPCSTLLSIIAPRLDRASPERGFLQKARQGTSFSTFPQETSSGGSSLPFRNQTINPSKKAKGNPSVSGPLTASLKGNNTILGDRPRVKDTERLAVDRPYLIIYSKTANMNTAKSNVLQAQDCGICHEEAEDPVREEIRFMVESDGSAKGSVQPVHFIHGFD